MDIDAAGHHFVTGRQVTPEELQTILKTHRINNPGRTTVIIRADRRAPWRSVVPAMNACHQSKIDDYRVSTKPDDESGDKPDDKRGETDPSRE